MRRSGGPAGWGGTTLPTPMNVCFTSLLLPSLYHISVKWASPQSCHAHWVREGSERHTAGLRASARASAPFVLEPESMKMLVMGRGSQGWASSQVFIEGLLTGQQLVLREAPRHSGAHSLKGNQRRDNSLPGASTQRRSPPT